MPWIGCDTLRDFGIDYNTPCDYLEDCLETARQVIKNIVRRSLAKPYQTGQDTRDCTIVSRKQLAHGYEKKTDMIMNNTLQLLKSLSFSFPSHTIQYMHYQHCVDSL